MDKIFYISLIKYIIFYPYNEMNIDECKCRQSAVSSQQSAVSSQQIPFLMQ